MGLALHLDTVMTVMLIRFALLAATVSVLLVVGFTSVLVLKRNGRLDDVTRSVGPAARALGRSRALDPARSGRRPGLRRRALLSVLDLLGAADRERSRK